MTHFSMGKYDGAQIGLCRLTLQVFDPQMPAVFANVESRAKTSAKEIDLTEAEKGEINRFVKIRHGQKAFGLFELAEERDPVHQWKYMTGIALGELGAHAIRQAVSDAGIAAEQIDPAKAPHDVVRRRSVDGRTASVQPLATGFSVRLEEEHALALQHLAQGRVLHAYAVGPVLASAAAEMGVWDMDVASGVAVVNAEYCAIYGLPARDRTLSREEWLADESGYDEETFPQLKAFVEGGGRIVWDGFDGND